MNLVSVTRLRIKSPIYLIPFLLENAKTKRQVRRSPGFLGGRLLVDRNRTFWTMTVWDSADSMRSYRNNGAHRAAMPKLAGWCSDACTVHWTPAERVLPDWLEAHAHMIAEGREFPVAARSASFDVKGIPVPRLSPFFSRPLTPAAAARTATSG